MALQEAQKTNLELVRRPKGHDRELLAVRLLALEPQIRQKALKVCPVRHLAGEWADHVFEDRALPVIDSWEERGACSFEAHVMAVCGQGLLDLLRGLKSFNAARWREAIAAEFDPELDKRRTAPNDDLDLKKWLESIECPRVRTILANAATDGELWTWEEVAEQLGCYEGRARLYLTQAKEEFSKYVGMVEKFDSSRFSEGCEVIHAFDDNGQGLLI